MIPVVREAALNLRANLGRSALAAGVLVLVIGFTVGLDLRETSRALAVERELSSAGRYVGIASSDIGLDRSTCHSLQWSEGVVASASFDILGPTELIRRPMATYQIATTTPGSEKVWGTESKRAEGSIWLGPALVADLARLPPTIVSEDLGARPLQVAGTLSQSRNQVIERWIVAEIPPTGTTSSCWVEWEPSVYQAGLVSMSSLLGLIDEGIVRELLSVDEFDVDPQLLVEERTARYAWVAAGLIAAISGWLLNRSRRPEFALYRAVGFTRREVYAINQLETAGLALLLLPLTIGIVITLHWILVAPPTGSQVILATKAAGLAAAGAILMSPVGTLFLGREGLATTLKDR